MYLDDNPIRTLLNSLLSHILQKQVYIAKSRRRLDRQSAEAPYLAPVPFDD